MPHYNQALRHFQGSRDAVLLCAFSRSQQGRYVVARTTINVPSIHNQTPTNSRAILSNVLSSLLGSEATEVPQVPFVAPEVPELAPSAPVQTRNRKPPSRYTFRPNGEPARGTTITYKKQYGSKAQIKKRLAQAKRNQTMKAKKDARDERIRAQGARAAKAASLSG